jgi:hypothetical protein
VQHLTDILRESYKTELMGLRERLRTLEGVANPIMRNENPGASPPSDNSRKPQAKRD